VTDLGSGRLNLPEPTPALRGSLLGSCNYETISNDGSSCYSRRSWLIRPKFRGPALRLPDFSLPAAARATGIEPVSLVEMTAAGPLCQTRLVADGGNAAPFLAFRRAALRAHLPIGPSASGVGKKSDLGISY
jgi:hypothetical protein